MVGASYSAQVPHSKSQKKQAYITSGYNRVSKVEEGIDGLEMIQGDATHPWEDQNS